MKNQELILDENHVYRLMPRGTVVPGVSEILESVFPFQGRGKAVDRACRFGTAVHRAIELEIKGTLDPATVDTSTQPYFDQFWKFLVEYNLLKTQCKTEVMLYSKKHHFAGRIDCVESRILDWKTGAQCPTHRLRIAAYRHLWNINNPGNKIKEAWLVYLDGGDAMPEIVKEKPSDFGVFLSCLEVLTFRKGNRL